MTSRTPLSGRFARFFAAMLAAMLGACNWVLGIDEGKPGTGGQAGASSSTAGAAGSSGPGGSAGAGGGTGGGPTGGTGGAPTGGAGAGGGSGGGGTGGASGGAGGGGTGGTGGSGGGGGAGGLTEGLSLLLHMDESDWSGAGAVLDASGNGNHGTVFGSATPDPAGKIGGAGLFDSGGWVIVPDSVSLHPSTELTCAIWVYPTGLTGMSPFPAPGIVSKREGYMVNVAFTLFLWDNSNAYVDIEADRMHTVASFSNGQWYHLALVYNGNEPAGLRTRLYVNGVLDSVHAAVGSLSPNTQDIQVGNLPGGGEAFIGKLDELAIWTRALTDAEIQAVYQNGAP